MSHWHMAYPVVQTQHEFDGDDLIWVGYCERCGTWFLVHIGQTTAIVRVRVDGPTCPQCIPEPSETPPPGPPPNAGTPRADPADPPSRSLVSDLASRRTVTLGNGWDLVRANAETPRPHA